MAFFVSTIFYFYAQIEIALMLPILLKGRSLELTETLCQRCTYPAISTIANTLISSFQTERYRGLHHRRCGQLHAEH